MFLLGSLLCKPSLKNCVPYFYSEYLYVFFQVSAKYLSILLRVESWSWSEASFHLFVRSS